jgi:ABC-type antimicrobial peptide transport system permease subunit
VIIVGFALAAVLLSAVGVSGVLACYVARQHREIGIRLALGADAGRISGMIVKRGLVCAACGVVIGTLLSLFVTRSLDALLFGVGGTDMDTLAGAAVLLLSIALAASWLPARRAARVDAMVALRAE